MNVNFPAHHYYYQRAALLTTTSPVAGDPTWGLRRRLLLDEERQQVFTDLEIQLSQKQKLNGSIKACIHQGAEVHGGRWSPTSTGCQFGREEKEEEELVMRKVEVKVDRQRLGIIGWSKQALAILAKFVLVLVILYLILIISDVW